GWMGTMIFGAGLAGMLFFGWSSDQMRERRWHFAIPQLTAALALTAWFFLPRSNVMLVVIFALVGFGTIAYLPSFWALPSAFLSTSAAAAAVGFINCTASIAIKFACCGKWFPCHQCHAERADHTASLWSREHFDEGAVLCGACGHQLTIREYLDSGSVCPRCGRQFNPGCARHHYFYFAT